MYPEANRDILRTGIIFHDIGKSVELVRIGTTFDYSIEGKLVGHMALGIEMVRKLLPDGMPPLLWARIQHIILSHHGELQLGSPVLPQTIEAVIVVKIDQLSSLTRQYQVALQTDAEKSFSSYIPRLGVQIYTDPYVSEPEDNSGAKTEQVNQDIKPETKKTDSTEDADQVEMF